jgi:multidrug efflux pump subunit AcrB
MNLTRLALRNAQFVIILLLVGILLSVQSFISMSRSEDPQVSFPFYLVTTIVPGTSPEDMETLVVDPLEEGLKNLDDIDRIETVILENVAIIQLEATFDIDPDDKLQEVIREVNTVRPNLPSGVSSIKIEQIKPEERVNFLLYAINSNVASYAHLNDFAENLEDRLERVKGISSIDIEANPREEIRVSLDYQRMAALNVSFTQIAGILNSNNANIPGGEVSAGSKSFSIKSTGGYGNIEEIKNTIVAANDNRIVYLKDVADIKFNHEDLLWKAEYSNSKAVFVSLKLKRGVNIIDVDREARAVADEYAKELPPNVKLDLAFEQASAVKQRINAFFINLLQGIALVGLVIMLFLGWRASFIIVTLIPICAILALAILNSAGYGLQQISIAALVLALGLLVDNGIVVIENISRFIKEGFSKAEAARKGTMEVGAAVASSTVTTVLSFFPLSQLGDAAGLFLISLPLTVVFTLVISLILALTFSPIMSKWVLRNHIPDQPTLADKFFRWLSENVYQPVLNFSLRFGALVVTLAIGITIFSVMLFPKIGVSFFPTADKALLLIDIDGPIGNNIDETEKAVNYVEDILDDLEIVTDYTSSVGNGNPQVFYNRIPKTRQKNHGQVMANLKEWENKSFYTTIANLRKKFAEFPGARITVEELKNGAPTNPFEIRILGDDLKLQKQMAQQVEDVMRSTEGIININNPLSRNKTELVVKLDKEKAGLLNISHLDFDRIVRASLNGLQIDNITIGEDDYALVLRMPFTDEPNVEDFKKIYITNRLGAQVPLSHVAEVKFEGAPSVLRHYDLNRFARVIASAVNLDETIPMTFDLIEKLDALNWPPGFSYEVGGEFEEQQQTFGSLGIILGLAMIGIFAVLVLQFRSVLQPFIVFVAILLALSGSFVALYLSGWPFSFFAFVGLISLMGIVVNNSIIMVDYMNQLMNDGIEKRKAIIKGSITRLKPILLTTLTTILGLLPLALKKTNQWSPLCMTIIGGMISSTILTLIVVPVIYNWFTRDREVEEVLT